MQYITGNRTYNIHVAFAFACLHTVLPYAILDLSCHFAASTYIYNIYIYIYKGKYMYTRIYIYIYTHIYNTYILVHTYIYTPICKYIYIIYVYICIYDMYVYDGKVSHWWFHFFLTGCWAANRHGLPGLAKSTVTRCLPMIGFAFCFTCACWNLCGETDF